MKIICPQTKNTLTLTSDKENELSILHLLWMHSFYNNKALCAGLGKCGKCKILFVSAPPAASLDELQILSEEEINKGIRLACKHKANPTYLIELLEDNPYSSEEESRNFLEYSAEFKNSQLFSSLETKTIAVCLAIDFGTTTMEYELFDTDIVYASGKELNPMQGIGSEIMTRLEFAKDKVQATLLKEKCLERLRKITKKANELGFIIEKIIFSANSAMTYLAFGFESSSLASAPYSLDFKGNCLLEFENLAPIYIPPLLAPFIGGDISSGLYALKKSKNLEYPYLYIDMGTNAEFALALSEDELYITSVPLGPSIEGIGLTFGTLATASSIIDFHVTPKGLIPEIYDKNIQKPSGICGIAYLNLLSSLKKLSLLDKSGHFSVEDGIALAKKFATTFHYKGVECLKINSDFYLSSSDIEQILMVKSAFRTAYEILLHEASKKNTELSQNVIRSIYLAGALGKYSKQESLLELGFLPNIVQQNIEQIGNMSLLGAKFLCSEKNQDDINDTFTNFTQIELAKHSLFQDYYMKHFSLSD